MDLNKLYEIISNKYSKEELQSIYYNNSKHYMEKWAKNEFNISWYFLEKIILNFYNIEKKPKDIWKKQQVDHMWETKRKKYPNGNYDYDKFKTTMDEKYGGIGNASPVIFEKQKAKCLELYGYECLLLAPDVQEKSHSKEAFEQGRQTLFEKTGYYSNFSNPKVTAKAMAGHTYESYEKANKTREITISSYDGGKEKFYQDCLTKAQETINNYEGGRDKFYSDRQKKINKCRRYLFDGLHFDSSWELAFYIFNKDSNINIIKCEEHFNYKYNNKTYSYFPDFKIDNDYIDVKGDHYLNSDGTLRKVYRNQNIDKLKCKYDCIINNNVKLVSYDDIKSMITYCINKFKDKNWHKKFLVY